MEAFAGYLLKSYVWLSGFALVYLIFLRNERFFLIKRYYLLAGILTALIFPFVSIRYQVELPAAEFSNVTMAPPDTSYYPVVSEGVTTGSFDIRKMLLYSYLAGALILIIRFLWQAVSIMRMIGKSALHKRDCTKLVRTGGLYSSFSFFNYVFVGSEVSDQELDEIMNHELVHVKQKHWFDLILAELLRVLQWMNPFAWIYSGFIRQNHEYLADESALQKTSDPSVYKAVLANQILGLPVFSISNSFSFSINKKRFDMMNRIITSPYRKLKVLFVLPVFAVVLYAFAEADYNYAAQPADPVNIELAANAAPAGNDVTQLNPPVTNEQGTTITEEITDQKQVKGVVLKEDGQPLAGVDITTTGAMGNAYAVTTDNEGRFVLNNITPDQSLLFFCRGYRQMTLKPDFSKEMSVRLERDPEYMPPPQRPVPIVVIDGVISETPYPDAMRELGYDLGPVRLLPPNEATEKYGEKAVNGVYEVTTRKKALEMGIRSPLPRLAPEDYPTFQGQRHTVFNEWVASRVRYPEAAKEKMLEGWITVNLNIELDGAISNIAAGPGTDPVLGGEVIRVISTAPAWDKPKNPDVDSPLPLSVTVGFRLPDQILKDPPYIVVEQMPMYPGGETELLNFLNNNLVYPEAAKAEKIEGRVILRFIVTTKGNAESVSVLKSVHPLLDAEAVKTVSKLSGFKPGMQDGKAVNVWYMVPVTFSLRQDTP